MVMGIYNGVIALGLLAILSTSQSCKTVGNVTQEIDSLLFPHEDYKNYYNHDYTYNPLRIFKMHHCQPFYLQSANLLVIHGPKCSTLPVKMVDYEDKTTTFSVRWTNIQIITENSFESWNGISHLEIFENDHLEKLSGGAFKGLNNLEKLSIVDNKKLNALHEDTFAALHALKELSLKGNNFHKLHHMTLGIQPLHVPNLRKVDLSNNPITSIAQEDFIPMSHLKLNELILKQVDLKYIGHQPFENLKNLQHIELGSNHSTDSYVELLKSLNEGHNLSVIGLHNVDLSEDTDTLVKILTSYYYKSVTLRGANITVLEIDKTIRVEKLKEIEISDSSLSIFPKQFFNSDLFPFISKLILRNNKLKSLPTNLSKSSVELIDLTGNQLTILSSRSFYFAPKLKVLILSRMSMHKIDTDAFLNNNDLIFLDLSHNNFSVSSRYFSKEIFSGLNDLEALDMSYNHISEFGSDDIFDYLINVQFLSLKSNYLKTFDLKLFKSMTCLKKLDLRKNSFLYLDPLLFENHLIKDIGIYSSLYKVDEKLISWFKQLLIIDRESDSNNCSQVLIISRNQYKQITNINRSPKILRSSICKIYIKTNSNTDDQFNNTSTQTNPDVNLNYTNTNSSEDDIIYILFKHRYVYTSLSNNSLSIIRFLYVVTFYLVVFCVITLITCKAITMIGRCNKKKRELLFIDDKQGFYGYDNRAFTIPYKQMKDEKGPQTP